MRIGFITLIAVMATSCVSPPMEPLPTDQAPLEILDQPLPPTNSSGDQHADLAPETAPEAFPAVRSDDVIDQVTEVIEEYLAATDTATESGGVDSGPMRRVVTEQWMMNEQRGFDDYRSRGIRTLGATVWSELSVQSARWTAQGQLEVAAFACVDARSVWVVPADAPQPPEDLLEWLRMGSPPDWPTDQQVGSWQEFIADASPSAGSIDPVLIWIVGQAEDQLRIDALESWRGYHPCEATDESD